MSFKIKVLKRGSHFYLEEIDIHGDKTVVMRLSAQHSTLKIKKFVETLWIH